MSDFCPFVDAGTWSRIQGGVRDCPPCLSTFEFRHVVSVLISTVLTAAFCSAVRFRKESSVAGSLSQSIACTHAQPASGNAQTHKHNNTHKHTQHTNTRITLTRGAAVQRCRCHGRVSVGGGTCGGAPFQLHSHSLGLSLLASSLKLAA